jgi:hypothetical protein
MGAQGLRRSKCRGRVDGILLSHLTTSTPRTAAANERSPDPIAPGVVRVVFVFLLQMTMRSRREEVL